VPDGLSSPHSPRLVDGQWFVCDSAADSIAVFDAGTRRAIRRIPCGGWTRGLAITPDFAFVGVSGDRLTKGRRRAELVVLDRVTWETVARYPLPSREVYDVTILPQPLVDGLRAGFQHNATRTGEAARHDLLRDVGTFEPSTIWPVGEALAETDARCAIVATLPQTCMAGDLLELSVTVTNLGSAFFTSAPPFPTTLSYRWTDARGNTIVPGRATRSPLPASLAPRVMAPVVCRIGVPATPGDAVLTITLVQDGVRWFDEIGRENAVSAQIRVVTREA
jgi:hypothetical protein